MKIIAVSGPSNSGKTLTLNKLFEVLTENVMPQDMDFEITNNKKVNEFITVFNYVKKDFNKNIGIYTGEDNKDIVGCFLKSMNNPSNDEKLKDLNILKIDIVIIACLTAGDTRNLIELENKNGNIIEYFNVTKLNTNEENIDNDSNAEVALFKLENSSLIYRIISRNVALLRKIIEH